MKNNIKSSFFFCLFHLTLFAQVEVRTSGSTLLGNTWTPNDPNNEVTMQCFGLNALSYRPGGKLSFGDYGSAANGNANVFVGEWSNFDSDGLQLHGNTGIYFTTGGQGSFQVARITSSGDLHVRGSITAFSSIFSDMRLKKNVKAISSPLQTIKLLRGISYDWKTDKDEEWLASLQRMRSTDEKGVRNLEQSKKEAQDRIRESANQIGFIAQEVQSVLPQLVKTNTDGMLSVNYVSVIPILVEGIKEQQAQIDDLKKQIDQLRVLIGNR